eukprot:TRINITY_DN7564_c0_g1_i2.p1 TRINITY_DN7564_c0_g1~~TRINITY_DN7564_c0_g1_i2.p1  ORF type:complete len:571 (+),score=83.66 TRINITY_DN7564_c0_g1_i2:342-2054(+)
MKGSSSTVIPPPPQGAPPNTTGGSSGRSTSEQPGTTVSTSASEAPTSLAPTSLVPALPADAADKNNKSLAEDFARIDRSHDWDKSPYVSQARLDSLWTYLFSTYYKEVPPVPGDGGPLAVGVGINVVKFKNFDVVAGTMNVAINLRLCWLDERLSFNAVDFFGRNWTHEGDKIPVKASLVWTPDITVMNEVGGLQALLKARASPLVLADNAFRNQTGVNLLWSHPLDVKSKCEVDMSLYPFDEQVCYIVIGSWSSSRRQLDLIPQPFFQEDTVHTSEFRVYNITVSERDVYTKGTDQTFNEVVYSVVLRRYPHYYVINYILPMVGMTLLTVATMWMSPGNVGPRVNSGTKMLLCVISIIFITARNRPAISGDIWMDRFQSHCLALSMSAVLESLFIDWLSKVSLKTHLVPKPNKVDLVLRALLAVAATYVIFSDADEVRSSLDGDSELMNNYHLWLFANLREPSTRLLVCFIYFLIGGLLVSSCCSILWLVTPVTVKRRMLRNSKKMEELDETASGWSPMADSPGAVPVDRMSNTSASPRRLGDDRLDRLSDDGYIVCATSDSVSEVRHR